MTARAAGYWQRYRQRTQPEQPKRRALRATGDDVARWRKANGLPSYTHTDELLVECWCQRWCMHVPASWVVNTRTWSCGRDCRG